MEEKTVTMSLNKQEILIISKALTKEQLSKMQFDTELDEITTKMAVSYMELTKE